jgi:hypothetical protein
VLSQDITEGLYVMHTTLANEKEINGEPSQNYASPLGAFDRIIIDRIVF